MTGFIKKTISCVLLVCLIFSFSTVTLAKEYILNELGVSLEMPEGWFVFDKNSKIEDYSLDEEIFDACMSTFEMNPAVFMYAVSPSYDTEILITYNANTQEINYNSIPDEMLEELTETFKEEFSNMGMSVESCSVYEGTNTKYIKILYSRPGQDIYTVQHSTSTTENAVNITLNSYYDEINSEDENNAKAVADSLTGLSEDLFAVKDIVVESDPVFNLEEMSYKWLVGAVSGAIICGIGFLFKGIKGKNEKEKNVETDNKEE